MPTTPARRRLPTPKPGVQRSSRSTKPAVEGTKNAPTSPESKMPETSQRFTKRVKISAESLKGILTAENPPQEVTRLKELLRDRIKDGRNQGLRQWRVYAAIDEAYDAPFHQITPTLIGKVLDGSGKMKPEEIAKEFEKWGLSLDTLLIDVPHPTDKTKRVKMINNETFRKILVPIVKSVLNARESKLFNERDNNPFFVYSPNKLTEEYKAVGDIITQVTETMVVQYGLKATLRSAIHQALKYSFALVFPAEAWHYEEDMDDAGKEYTRKEGLRYNIPHPTRCARDINFRPSTFNSDTGCEWAFYWHIERYGDVDTNPVFFNKAKISYGSHWWGGTYDTYFQQLYPCTMEHPAGPWFGGGSYAGPKDREQQAQFYASNQQDKAVFLNDFFIKLSPKQWGLGEWKHKLWFRFVVANDDTIVYAEPLPYSPVLYLGSDADDSTSTHTASFALEAVPWQDLVGNVLSQHLIALRQNCMKVIPYDETQVTEEQIRQIEARSKQAINVVWMPYNPREARVQQVDPSKMFSPVVFPQQNTTEIIGTITQVFNIMERALGLSAQEVGAIAGHIQTAEEIRTVAQNQSSRVEFIGSFIDEFVDAWKRQIYTASQAFMDKDFVVYVNGVTDGIATKLKDKYGFKLGEPFEGKVEVSGDRTKFSVDAFISTREGKTRINQPQIAQVIMQTIAAVAGNERLAGSADVGELFRLLNRAMKLAGAPEDADIRAIPEATALNEMKKVMEAIQQLTKQMTQAAANQASQIATQQATQASAKMVEEAVGAVVKQATPAIQATQAMAQDTAQDVQETQVAVMTIGEQQQKLAALVMQLKQMLEVMTAMTPPPAPAPAPVVTNEPVVVV